MKRILLILFSALALRAQDASIVNVQQTASGSITAAATTCTATACVYLTMPYSSGAATIALTGTWTATVQFESSADGTNYAAISALGVGAQATVNGNYNFFMGGQRFLRARASAYTSGTVAVVISSSLANGGTVNGAYVGSTASFAGNIYAANMQYRTGNTFIALGDSIEGASTVYSSVTESLSFNWPNQVNIRSGQNIRYLYNAGIAGNTCAQMLARNQTDVINRAPAVAALKCGTNDVAGVFSLTSSSASITSIITAWIQAGIRPILCTIPPRSDNDSYIPNILQLNAWIRKYAQANGITLVDFYTILVDPSNAHYRSGYSSDGVHPTATIASAMADYFIARTNGMFPAWSPTVGYNNAAGDTVNLVLNSLFGSGGGAPTNWNFSGNNCTHSAVANTIPPGGNWFQFVCTNLGTDEIYQDITTGWSVGDKLAFSGKINTSGATSGALTYSIKLDMLNGTPFISVPLNAYAIDETGTFYIEATVTAGTTNVRPHIDIASGTGTIQISQWSVIDLTSQGLQ